MSRYLIIGNSIAAVGCIEGIRSVDTGGDITVVSEENHPVYGRPLISYYLEGKTDLSKMNYRKDSFYDDNNCRVIYGSRATAVDSERKSVTLSDGDILNYDKLCIATGSRPFIPPFEGLDTVENKFTFMTLDDTLSLEKSLKKDAKVLIVGAGLIGLKCAEGIKEKVGGITVCDLADRVLSSILDCDCAAFVQNHLEDNGIEFMLGNTVVTFDCNRAKRKNGKIVEFDILVLAVGVRANSELIKDAGGQTGRGIIIDEKSKTSLPDIWAAGDCAEGYDSSIGKNRVIAILPDAYIQGNVAGVNMAGGDKVFDNAIPMNSIGFFGLHMMTAGAYEGEMFEEKDEQEIKRLFVSDNQLRGYILIGKTERAGIYTSLIREKTPLDSIDFELTKKVASNMIYSKEIRRNKFGGVV